MDVLRDLADDDCSPPENHAADARAATGPSEGSKGIVLSIADGTHRGATTNPNHSIGNVSTRRIFRHLHIGAGPSAFAVSMLRYIINTAALGRVEKRQRRVVSVARSVGSVDPADISVILDDLFWWSAPKTKIMNSGRGHETPGLAP